MPPHWLVELHKKLQMKESQTHHVASFFGLVPLRRRRSSQLELKENFIIHYSLLPMDRDPASSKGKYEELSDEQELFIRYLAFTVHRFRFGTPPVPVVGNYFARICNSCRTATGEPPFGDKASTKRRTAQLLLGNYLNRLKRGNDISEPVLFVPASFLNQDSSSRLISVISTSTRSLSPISSPTARSITPPPQAPTPGIAFTDRGGNHHPFPRTNINHPQSASKSSMVNRRSTSEKEDTPDFSNWRRIANDTILRDGVCLFHNDESFEEGYGPSMNRPGFHCIVNKSVSDGGTFLHTQLGVFYRCSYEDSGVVEATLNHELNAMELQVPIMSSLALTHLGKMQRVMAANCGVNAARDENFSAMIETLTTHQSELVWNPLRKVHVPVKIMPVFFPPPFSCNNEAFNDDVRNNYELKANVLVTTSMSEDILAMAVDSIDSTMSQVYFADEVAPDETTSGDATMGDGERGTKRSKSAADRVQLRQIAAQKLSNLVLDTDVNVLVLFQMPVDANTKRLFKKKSDRMQDLDSRFKKGLDLQG